MHRVSVVASVPVVDIAARETSSRTFPLPRLDYTLELSTACARPFDPISLVVTVADSHQRIDAQQLAADAGKSHVTLAVPADQLAPVPVPEFCLLLESEAVNGDPPTATAASAQTLTLSGALSANVSLRCSDGERQEIVYRSQPLDVTLRCDAGESPDASSEPGDPE